MEHINFRESGTEANFKVIYEDTFSLSLYNDTVNIVLYFILL